MLLLAVLACAVIGGIIGIKLKLPASAMLGSLIAVAVFTVITDIQATPSWIKVLAQMVSGGYIGTTMTSDSIGQMKKMAPTAAFLLLGMLVINLGTGFILYLTSPLDLCTSLFCHDSRRPDRCHYHKRRHGRRFGSGQRFPGVPHVGRHIYIPADNPKAAAHKIRRVKGQKRPRKMKASMTKQQYLNFGRTILVAFCSGLLGYLSGIPAGTIIFSVIGVSFIQDKNYGVGFIPFPLQAGGPRCFRAPS